MANLTGEQQANLETWRDGEENFSIDAKAGSGKTFQIKLNVQACPDASHLILYFNKRNAEEAKDQGFNGQTAHSFGLSIIKENLDRRPKVNFRKWYNVIGDPEEGEKLRETVSLVSRLYESCIGQKDLLSQEKVENAALELGVPVLPLPRVAKAFEKALFLAEQGDISFSDMIVLPVYHAWTPFGNPDHLYLDEAQDLSPAKQELAKLAGASRVCIVGDPNQAIYGFAGADENSFAHLLQTFPGPAGRLTTCFRCSHAVIKEAQAYVPEIQPWPQAKEGRVFYNHTLSIFDLTPGSAVLCRNNRPLFSLALSALASGVPVTMRGKDFCEAILSLIAKAEGKTKEAKLLWLTRQEEREKQGKKKSLISLIEDRYECARLIVQSGAEEKILRIFSDEDELGRLPVLSTIHKAKGLEWEKVFLYRPDLIGSEGQENNLKYVGITRAQKDLYYAYPKNGE